MIKVKLQPCARMPEYDEKNRLKIYALAVNASRKVHFSGRVGYNVKVYTGVSMSGVFDFDIREGGYPFDWHYLGMTQDQEEEMPGIVIEFFLAKMTDEAWDFMQTLTRRERPCLYATPADQIRPRIYEVKTDTEK